MTVVFIRIILLFLLIFPAIVLAGTSSREAIVAAMQEFLTCDWYSAYEDPEDPDDDYCIESNFLHENYLRATCENTEVDNHCCSDFLWHPDYLARIIHESPDLVHFTT